MNFLKRQLTRLKLALFPVKPQDKVGAGGLWQEGSIMDMGDCYVAYISVNGRDNAVMVRAATMKAVTARRKQIIDAVMRDSREEAARQQAAVQLIARTKGDDTENLSNQ